VQKEEKNTNPSRTFEHASKKLTNIHIYCVRFYFDPKPAKGLVLVTPGCRRASPAGGEVEGA
jgi:hypothetical protein